MAKDGGMVRECQGDGTWQRGTVIGGNDSEDGWYAGVQN